MGVSSDTQHYQALGCARCSRELERIDNDSLVPGNQGAVNVDGIVMC